jgi:tripartite-type tricarboxylate transporter receptor subunit TctC
MRLKFLLAGRMVPVLVAACVAGAAASADEVADFYRGRTVTLLVGGDPGGAYDVYARLLARHIAPRIPGNPKIIMQYIPGAGSVIATNYLFNVAPQDGTVVLAPNRTAALAPLMGQPGARFDPARINWLGSLNNEVGVMQVWGENPVKSIADARRTAVIVGSTSPLTDSDEYPTLLNNTLGTKFQMVRGYASIEAVQLALERGEIQGQENSYSGMTQHFPDWRSKMSVLVQLSLTKHPQMPDIPLIFDFMKPELVANGLTVDEVDTLWRTILSQQSIGRPYALGPGVPPERVAALRAAFKSAIEDPQLREDAARRNLELFPLAGADIQTMIAKVAALPPAVGAQLRQLIVGKSPPPRDPRRR